MKTLNTILALACATATAVIGNNIHHSIFWTVVDFFFWPFAWIKWLICQEVTLSIIKQSFAFFFS